MFLEYIIPLDRPCVCGYNPLSTTPINQHMQSKANKYITAKKLKEAESQVNRLYHQTLCDGAQ